MKKLSLSNLSKHALDKFQQNSIHGGSLPSCICAHICDNCGCSSSQDQAVFFNESGGQIDTGIMADILMDTSN
ncbi:MAG: hypothetical protein RR555_10320 [Bacteroidales bacterium]